MIRLSLGKQSGSLDSRHQLVAYLDADTFCLKNPDCLFEVDLSEEAGVAACSDMGWPDCFNVLFFSMFPRLALVDKRLSRV